MGFNHSISGERTLFQAPLTALLDKLVATCADTIVIQTPPIQILTL
jgi:hypothetical protein